ncbi:hypothetical protein C6497_04415 [Candidatus Poribacteria bacterium]|nr:MAG: hypothetical protein C6497_04415 [Candidatus Poribacteria bacterium]
MTQLLNDCFESYSSLRTEMRRWLNQSMMLDPPGPNDGGEDEANYALAWFPHYLITGDSNVLKHFNTLKDALAGWVKRDCFHGYEKKAEAHHGPEPFLLFLPRYIGLKPEDTEAISLLTDAAEHIGNWVSEIPDWYDYTRDTFIGYNIGTEFVDNQDKDRYELAEHFRFIHIALATYKITGEKRYVDWAIRYGQKRAERILTASEPMPLLWDLNENGLSEEEVNEKNLHRLVASGHHIPGDPLAGIENLLASGAIYALGDLYLLTGEEIYKSAARRIVEPLVTSLIDPFNDPAAAAISYYRWTFRDTSFDTVIEAGLQDLPTDPPELLALVFPQEIRRRELGVGKRSDMAYWGEWTDDGSVSPIREPSTATLTLAYQLTGDVAYAQRAIQNASLRLNIARRVLRGGREHADMGGAVCSVAAGHGRNWGHGAVTACYGPLLLGTREIFGMVEPLIIIKHEDGTLHHPSELLSLVRPVVSSDNIEIIFYNSGNSTLNFSWQHQLMQIDQLDHRIEKITESDKNLWYGETLEANRMLKRIL